jgi:hypothetical protein
MSSDRFSETTPADAPSYDGTPAPIQTSGTLSTGAVIMPRVQSQVSPQVNTQFPQGVPAPVAVQLSGLPFVNATPSGTEGVQASLQVTVTD